MPASHGHAAYRRENPKSKLLRTLMLQPQKCMIWAEVLGAAPRVHMLELCTTTVLQPRAATFRDGSAEQM